MVPRLHFFVAFGAGGVQLRCQVFVEDGHENLAEVAAPGHPLEVVPTVVVVRAVELAAREGPLYPGEHGLMTDVHPQCHLGLSPIPPEVPFTDQQPDNEPFFEVSRQPSLLPAKPAGCWVFASAGDLRGVSPYGNTWNKEPGRASPPRRVRGL